MVWKLPLPHGLEKLPGVPKTPHDLAMCVGPWTYVGFILGMTVVGGCVMGGWFGLRYLGWSSLCLFLALRYSVIYFMAATNCLVLCGKYTVEGVRIEGRIAKISETDAVIKNIQVLYQVGEVHYSKNFKWSRGQQLMQQLNDTVDLVILPGYPRSAVLATDPEDISSPLTRLEHQLTSLPGVLLSTTGYLPFSWQRQQKMNEQFTCGGRNMMETLKLQNDFIFAQKEIVYSSIKDFVVDPDFMDRALPVTLVTMTFFGSVLVAQLPWFFNGFVDMEVDATATFLFCISFVGMTVLGFAGGYKNSIVYRDAEFHELVYGGAKAVDADGHGPVVPIAGTSSSSESTSLEKEEEEDHVYLSYEEVCQLNDPPLSYRTILQIAVRGALWYVYYVSFLGCFLMWYALAVPLWKRRLLRRYESERSSDISYTWGWVIWSDLTGGVIVLYQADDNQFYKKRLCVPMLLRGFMSGQQRIVHLKGFPESAIFKSCTRLGQEDAFFSVFALSWVLAIMVWQYKVFAEVLGFRDCYHYFLVVQFVMGFVGVLIQYQTVIQRKILDGGAKRITLVEDAPTSDKSSSNSTDGAVVGTTTPAAAEAPPPPPDEKEAPLHTTTTGVSVGNDGTEQS